MNFLELPDEMLCNIGEFASCRDLITLSRVCRLLHMVFTVEYISQRICAILPKQKHIVHQSGRYIQFFPGNTVLQEHSDQPYPLDGVYFYDSHDEDRVECSFFLKRFNKLLSSKSCKSGKLTCESAKKHVMTYRDKRKNAKFHSQNFGVIVTNKGKWGHWNDLDVEFGQLFDQGAIEIQQYWDEFNGKK